MKNDVEKDLVEYVKEDPSLREISKLQEELRRTRAAYNEADKLRCMHEASVLSLEQQVRKLMGANKALCDDVSALRAQLESHRAVNERVSQLYESREFPAAMSTKKKKS